VNVGELRAFVREQIDMDEVDLPDTRLNVYLQEAFDRTLAVAHDWPRNQKTWELFKPVGEMVVALPEDLDQTSILSVTNADTGNRLVGVDHGNLELAFAPMAVTVGAPAYFSVWANNLYLWPPCDVDDTCNVTIRGYKHPVWTNSAAEIPDIDSRLHVTLAYAALSLAYAREEDEVMEGIYSARWNRDLQQQLKTLRRPMTNQPAVYSGSPRWGAGAPYVIVPPELP
jgi:hypothetical protein